MEADLEERTKMKEETRIKEILTCSNLVGGDTMGGFSSKAYQEFKPKDAYSIFNTPKSTS